jgi:predicted HicB family RNase H-like nuclease
LLGTTRITLRIPAELVGALDGWAREEGISRNTLAGRELATAMNRRRLPSQAKERRA